MCSKEVSLWRDTATTPVLSGLNGWLSRGAEAAGGGRDLGCCACVAYCPILALGRLEAD